MIICTACTGSIANYRAYSVCGVHVLSYRNTYERCFLFFPRDQASITTIYDPALVVRRYRLGTARAALRMLRTRRASSHLVLE